MNKKVSIIIPAYNSEKFIERSIGSALSQTYENVEVVVIDDGSGDNTLSICKSIAERNERLKVFHISNSGPARARNFGIENSTGDWIMFLDSDDALKPEICEKLVGAANNNSADVAFCNLCNISEMGTSEYIPFHGSERFFKGDSKRSLERMLVSKISETRDTLLCLSGPFCKIIKKDILNGIVFPENISLGEDTCFCLDVISKSESVVYISDVLYLRYVRTDSLSGLRTDVAERLVQYTNWVIDRYYSDAYFSSAVKDLMANNFFNIIYIYFAKLSYLNFRQANGYINRYYKLQHSNLSIGDILHAGIPAKRRFLLITYSLKARRIVWIICKIIYGRNEK